MISSDNKSKSLWATVKEIKGLQNRGDTRVPDNPEEVAETFNKYFSTVAENILKNMKEVEFDHNMPYNLNTILFHQQSEEEIIKIGSILKNKNSCGIDGI
ncbi:hypothetical protein HHI36_006024 [Cryptolaemus montrouzieri]|uniref:Reverse transcriptase n=1 Tax=Cryptolaemus montrouzieri TaxID=559131 RepID=A0ABD2NWT2_9CUCU